MQEIEELKKIVLSFEERSKIRNNPTYKMNFNKEKFITPSPFKFNHNGLVIEAVFEPAYEETDRGYINHRINLIYNNKSVGYLKVFYMDKEFNKTYQPDILHFLSLNKGHDLNLSANPKIKDIDSENDLWVNKNRKEKIETLKKNWFVFFKRAVQ